MQALHYEMHQGDDAFGLDLARVLNGKRMHSLVLYGNRKLLLLVASSLN